MAKAENTTPAPERLHALDAVRGYALLLGVVFHATLSFIPVPSRIWIVQDDHPSTVLAVVFFVIHVFRMTTFFLIAGFFAHMSFHRRGPTGFIRDRLKRIALPLVVGWPLIMASLVAIGSWAYFGGYSGPPPPWPAFPGFPLTHLWFLYVLLKLYAAMLILRTAIAWIDRGGKFRAGVDRIVALVMHSPVAPAVLALPVAAAFAADPTWLMWFGIRTPDSSLLTNLQAWAGFGTAFAFGFVLHRQIDLIRILERRWALNLTLAIALIMACLFLAGLTPQLKPITDDPMAGAACYALAIWTASFAVIGLALRFLSGFSPARRYIADASYWIYLIHLPIVMALQVAVSRIDWFWPVKFAAILAVAFALLFASYQWMARDNFIGAVLNGRRAPRRAATAAAVASSAAT